MTFLSAKPTGERYERDSTGTLVAIILQNELADSEIETPWVCSYIIAGDALASLPPEGDPERGPAIRRLTVAYVKAMHAQWLDNEKRRKLSVVKTPEELQAVPEITPDELAGVVISPLPTLGGVTSQ